MQRSANISDEGRSTLENALFRTITLCIARTATAQALARPASPPYHSRARAGWARSRNHDRAAFRLWTLLVLAFRNLTLQQNAWQRILTTRNQPC